MAFRGLPIILALAAATGATLLGNLAANLIEKYAWSGRKGKRMDTRRRLLVIVVLFLVFSIPSGYLQYRQLTRPPTSAADAAPPATDARNREEMTVPEGKTGKFFGGEVFITTNKVSHVIGGYVVSATIGAVGQSTANLDEVEVGYAFVYGETVRYDVRVSEAGYISAGGLMAGARFVVTKLN